MSFPRGLKTPLTPPWREGCFLLDFIFQKIRIGTVACALAYTRGVARVETRISPLALKRERQNSTYSMGKKHLVLKSLKQIHREKGRKKKTVKVGRSFLTYLFLDGTIKRV